MALLNLNTQEVVWLRDMGTINVYNGEIYSRGGAYHTDKKEAWDRVNGVEFPEYYRIKADGTIEDLCNEEYKKVFQEGRFTNGKLVYEHNEYDRETETETDYVLIYDLLTGKAVTYTDYHTDMVYAIQCFDDYSFVKLEGKDYNYYFTAIDENGVELFEPIMYYYLVYSAGMAMYTTKYLGNYIVVDGQGNVIVPESAGYEYISDFKDGFAFAQIAKTKAWVIINTQGEVVADKFIVK